MAQAHMKMACTLAAANAIPAAAAGLAPAHPRVDSAHLAEVWEAASVEAVFLAAGKSIKHLEEQ